jgi:stage V sporulation protein R
MENSGNGALYLNHYFEGKPLYKDYIPNTMMGIEYLWGKPVKLETSELVETEKPRSSLFGQPVTPDQDEVEASQARQFRRVLYTMENRKITKKNL